MACRSPRLGSDGGCADPPHVEGPRLVSFYSLEGFCSDYDRCFRVVTIKLQHEAMDFWVTLWGKASLTPQLACVEAIGGDRRARIRRIPAGNDVANGTNTGESWITQLACVGLVGNVVPIGIGLIFVAGPR